MKPLVLLASLILMAVDAPSISQKNDLRYVVKEYQLLNVDAESPGFDWGKRSD